MTDRLKRQAERLAEILTRKEYEPLLRSLPLVAPRTPLDAQLSAAVAAVCPCAAGAMRGSRGAAPQLAPGETFADWMGTCHDHEEGE